MTPPSIRGNLADSWNKTECMETFITDVTDKHLVVVARIATFLTDFTLGALPTSPYHCVTFYLKLQAITMVMLSTGSTKELLVNITRLATHDTMRFVFGCKKYKRYGDIT